MCLVRTKTGGLDLFRPVSGTDIAQNLLSDLCSGSFGPDDLNFVFLSVIRFFGQTWFCFSIFALGNEEESSPSALHFGHQMSKNQTIVK